MSAGSVVVVFRGLLMSSSPVRAFDDVLGAARRCEDEAYEQVAYLGQTQGDEGAVAFGLVLFFERVTVRNAWASMERVMCRYQPVYWRTW